MSRPPNEAPTEAELAVLQVLWERGEATRRDIADVLYPAGGPSHYTTVQKLLERLERKGYVRRGGEAVRTFVALVSRDELIGQRLMDVAEKLAGGSLAPLLMNLVRTRPLTAQELDELRALVQQQPPPDPPKEEKP
jgi:BlaI family transcriptional regulator, penicillinase repressor